MRYEVLDRYKEGPNIPETVLAVRIFPEDTNPRELFVSLIQAAYDMDGLVGLGGLAGIGRPKFLTEKEAEKYIIYDSERTWKEKMFRRPDTRVPARIAVGFIEGRAVRLSVSQSNVVPGTYEMPTMVFERDVGRVDTFFNLVARKLK